MLRVLGVVPTGMVYGLQRMTLDFFRSMSRKAVDSHFLITRWSDGEFARRLEEAGIPYTSSWLGFISRKLDWVILRMTIHGLSKMPLLYRDFLRLVKTYRPNLIYTASHHQLIQLMPLLICLDIPVVCHMHDPPPPIRFQRFSSFLWGRVVNHFIAVSGDVKRRLEQLGIQPPKISRLDNGIDLSIFPFATRRSGKFIEQYGWPSDSVVIGMTGQIIEEKGHLDFLQALQEIRADYPSLRAVIGGRREGSFYESLRRAVARNAMEGFVSFSGWQEEVRNFFSGIDIFVSASRHDEGFGLVVAQAMATGLPVVATRSGGIKDVVQDGETGILVDKQCPAQLAQAIRYLIDRPDIRKSMGNAGRKRIETHFDLSEQALRLEGILNRVANPRGA